MQTTQTSEFWPMLSIAINVLIGILGYLVVRWIAQQIRIAILELENRLTEKYATKKDVERLESEIDKLRGLSSRRKDLAWSGGGA